ncbi:MAG TPA: OmpH family outer membrane protein [Bacteroidota bacterium]|nr:OmpH family outer membrane protein [Bacteroidota bacterium]
MNRILPFMAVALLALVMTAQAQSQNLKIGFVDSQKIFEGLPEAQEVQRDLDARLQTWQDTLETLSRNFQSEVEAYQAQQGTMSEAAKEQRQQELMRLQQQVQEYQKAKFGQGGEAARLRQSVLSPLQKKVLVAIEEVAKEEKLNFVFDKVEDAALLLYAEAKFDYTFKVLDRLKRGAK